MSDENKPIDSKDRKRLKTRGLGAGKEYLPFIYVNEMSSSGESVRVKSTTVGRVHHLLSGIELLAFLIFDWNSRTIDIREQYPLQIIDSLDICRQLGIRHPQMSGKLKVVTTDLLIDLDDNSQLAIAVKPSEQLSNTRTIEKLQIEKAYWEDRGVKWCIFTEQEISEAQRENLNWIRPYLDIETAAAHELTSSDVDDVLWRLKEQTGRVMRLCSKLDDQYQLEPGFHVTVLRYAIAHHFVCIPLNKPFHLWDCSDLDIVALDVAKGVDSVS
jgi:hypothetical protein